MFVFPSNHILLPGLGFLTLLLACYLFWHAYCAVVIFETLVQRVRSSYFYNSFPSTNTAILEKLLKQIPKLRVLLLLGHMSLRDMLEAIVTIAIFL